jgi:hypothetical protein
MASSYSADLQLELMVTGEKSGLWGDITNENLTILQQAIAGYEAISIAGGAQTTALTFSNGITSNGKNAVIKFTGTITGNQVVTIPDGIEKTYIIENGTTGTFTVQFKTVSGTGVTFATTDKSTKILFSDGTNIVDTGTVSLTGIQTLTNKTLTSPTITDPIINEINDSNGNEEIIFSTTASAVNEITVKNAATTAAPEISATGTDTNIDLKLTPKGAGKLNLDGIKFPNADGTAGQVLQTNGSGILSFATISAGTPTVDVYDTGTAATYTKPSTANWMLVELWGGGGSGGRSSSSNASGGGGGGSYNYAMIPFADLVGDVTYTVGAGGAGRTTNGNGNVGGTSSVSFANFQGLGTTKTISAFGGGGGRGSLTTAANSSASGGGGGTQTGAGVTSTSISVGGGNDVGSGYLEISNTDISATMGGGGGILSESTGGCTPPNRTLKNAAASIFGGGGGGAALTSTGGAGGKSYYGGGGGAGSRSNANTGGTSIWGGNGSNGVASGTVTADGGLPAGGSAGSQNANSGNGGGGRVRFTYW